MNTLLTVSLVILTVGVILYIISALLLDYYKNKEGKFDYGNDGWELTVKGGIVPRWVSAMGVISLLIIAIGVVTTVITLIAFYPV
ncbi:hypothetical protein LCGC14_1194410 [marine sediment metagenome]|uniref:Uncharacterized protein n=1 Tax=marine sediment metagenome TaxID=412755 RepID=A0A0F9P171_9ZZZZ